MTDVELTLSAVCRLCSNQIDESPIHLLTQSTTLCYTRADIIQQHFGIRVIPLDPENSASDDSAESTCVCQRCWNITDQFHQLFTTVHQNEIALRNTISQQHSVIKTEEHSKTDSFDNDLQYKVEVLVEDKDDDVETFEDAPPSPPPDKETPTARKRISSANRKTPVKHTANEIAEQDESIREFFQMHCEQCDTRFEVLRDAILHYRYEHGRRGYLKCCDKRFFNRTMMLDHMKHHRDPKAFHCERCDRSYIGQAALELHLASHDRRLSKEYKCVVCAAEFVKSFQLTKHQRTKHIVSSGMAVSCDICGKLFDTKYILLGHMRAVHIAAHICDMCGVTFKTKSLVIEHSRRVHSGIRKPKVQCGTCGALLADEQNLRKHQERHNQVAVACELCGRVTPNQFALAAHMRSMHSSKEFPCTMCEKSFKRAIGLREHLAIHTGVDLYTCLYCPRTFKSNANMFSHRKKEHPVEWSRDRAHRNRT